MRNVLFLMIAFGLFAFAVTVYEIPWNLDGYEVPTWFETIAFIVMMLIIPIELVKMIKNR